MTAPSNVHTAARQGYAKEAASYARGRPEYPPELAGWMRDVLGTSEGKRVADVGAGTGKFTKLLTQTGATVIAVEPVEQMRDAFATALPGVQVVPGSAQALPLEDASLDVIACAQAFHWFATTQVLDEFARALKPGGSLVLVWNVRDESVDWVAGITKLITPFEGDAPRFYKGDWKNPLPHPAFTALEEASFRYEHTGPAEAVIVDRIMSVSFIAALPPERNAHVRSELQRLANDHPALRGKASVSFPYRTLAFHCRRVS